MEYSLLSIFDSINDGLIILNHKSEITFWNNASENIFLYSKEEAIGSQVDLIFPKSCKQLNELDITELIFKNEISTIKKIIELAAQNKNGNNIITELSISSLMSKNQRYFCLILRDISDRKKEKKENLDLAGIIDSSPSCLKLITKEGNLLKMNRVGLDLIEAEDFESVRGANVYNLLADEDRDSFIEFNNRICKGEEGSLIFKLIGLKGTIRTMESFARFHMLENGEIAHLAITNDITERINTEKELIQKDQALEEATRLSVIGEFAAGIAHEINNPLSIIYAKSQLLEIQLQKLINIEDQELYPIKKSINSIIETSTHTSDIINNLKTFSRSTDFKDLEYYSLLDVTNMALKLSRKRCSNAGIHIDVNINSKIKVLCTPIGLSQVILNLIHNSFDALETLDEKWIKVEASIKEEKIQLTFTDSGNGIKPEISRKILQPFFTTKEL